MFLEDKSKFPLVDTKAEPFTLDSLISWLETKDPVEEYTYVNPATCLIGQWTGQSLVFWEIDEITFRGAMYLAMATPHSFGDALTRARSIKAGT